MLPNLNEIYLPKSVQDAVKILKKGKGKISVLGGNTSLGLSSNPNIVGLLDIEPLKLSYVKSQKGDLTIGAGTTISEIIASKSAQGYCCGIIKDACEAIGKLTNRNMITAGGNIVGLHPWSALPVALLALNADIVVAGTKKKIFKANEFFSKLPRQTLGAEGIVTEIKLPAEFSKAAGKYIKLALTENDYPLVSIAVVLKRKGGKIESAGITLGGLSLLPQRAKTAAELISGKVIDEKLASSAAKAAAEELNIGNDYRATKEYKKKVIENILKDALINL